MIFEAILTWAQYYYDFSPFIYDMLVFKHSDWLL